MGVKKKLFFVPFKIRGRKLSIVPGLLWIDEGVSGFSPGLHATCEACYIHVTHRHVLACLTGRSLFIMSASIEDDLLISC